MWLEKEKKTGEEKKGAFFCVGMTRKEVLGFRCRVYRKKGEEMKRRAVKPMEEKGNISRLHGTVKASITVEAVFIIPILMFLFLMFLWFCLYLHDRAIVEGVIFEMLEEGGEYVVYGALPDDGRIVEEKGSRGSLRYALADPSYEERRKWERSFARKLKRKLFLYEISGFSCDKTERGTKLKAVFRCAKFFPVKWFGLSELFYIEYEQERLFPVREEITRIGSVLLDMYENIMK